MPDHIAPVPDIDRALVNIVQVLQTSPRQYYAFGPYWWAVKAILKRHGYTTDQFYGLGESVDQEAMARMEAGPDAFILAQALDFFGYQTRFNGGSPDTYFPADGEPYHLFDEDLNL